MAKIPLRVYNHTIEKRIENHQTQEAVAHCKHILKYYPKHIDTYRLLGKAFLESQRYGEANDILQRVLSVVPDDFISQLGMSMIREDEGDLDSAIFHMERAFEVQPSNGAIQDELRRLYGRRDGIQPPKIRLTRGALVRMYGRGELFTQAIAEANAALGEDPERLDMQVLLSRLYYQSGDKVKATEVASKLADKLPYCYEANHILAEVLSTTSRPEDARSYQERLRALDPYLAFVSEAQPTSADVPDNAVMVDELEYDPEQDEPARPGWTQQVGLAWDETPAKEETPDWLAGELPPGERDIQLTGAGEEEEGTAQPAEIPDWMAAAGWKPSTGEEMETHVNFDEIGEDLPAPAEMPEWLQDLAPAAPAESVEETAQEAEEDTRWLEQILGPTETTEGTIEQPAAEADVPEWLKDLEGEKPEETAAEQPEAAMPDWTAMESGEPPEIAPAEVPEESQPDWMPAGENELTAESAQEIPDWLQELAQEPSAQETDMAEAESPKLEEVELPALPDAGIPAGEESAIAAPPEDMDAALAWLESLAARQGADEATLISQPEQRDAEMPEWLQKEVESADAAEETVPEAVNDQPAPEALEESVTTPTEATVPEWLEEQPMPVESAETPSDEEQIPAWLREQPDEMASGPEAAAEEEAIPEWLREQQPPVAAEEEPAEGTPVPDWLQEQPEPTPDVQSDAEDTQVPEWLQEQPQAVSSEPAIQEEVVEETSLPDWLQDLSEQSEAASEPGTGAHESKSDLPEWLEIPAAEAAETAEDAQQEGVDLPEWLNEVDQEAQEAAAEIPTREAEITAPEHDAQPEVPAAEAPNVPGEDIDAALAWLESLAVKQGADEETLVTRPEDRLETPPEWVQQAEEPEPAETLEADVIEMASEEELQPASEITEELPVMAAGEAEVATTDQIEEAEKTAEIPSAEEEPDNLGWVAAEEEPPAEKTQPVRIVTEETPAAPIYAEGVSLVDTEEEEEEQEPLPEWLRSLGSYSADLESDQEEQEHMAEWLPETDAYHERSEVIQEAVEAEGEITQDVMPVEPELAVVENAPAEEVEAEMPADTQPVQTAAPAEQLSERLQQAQTALEKGDTSAALADYNQFIQNGELLEETIHDLRDALYRHPVDVDIWQSLGDAYMRSNRIQEALDAYTKAEELLR